MKYLIPFLILPLSCTGSARQTHVNVADAVSQGINTVVPTIVEEYKVQLRECRVNGEVYALCASKVDERWSHFRDLFRQTRRLQDEYATAIETHSPNALNYIQFLNTAWCQLVTVAPFKMPEVPGVSCDK
jgi:hypothetical protein